MDDKIEALKTAVKPAAPKPVAPKVATAAAKPVTPAPKPAPAPEPVVDEDPEAGNLSPSVLAERAAGRAALKK